MVLALASPTDIEVSINLDKISILAGSVLELSVSKDQLDLSGNGFGSCRLTSTKSSLFTTCRAVENAKEFVLTTGPIIEGQ